MQLEKLTDLYFKLFPQTGYHVSANDQPSLALLSTGLPVVSLGFLD
jgi:hypothetical protein